MSMTLFRTRLALLLCFAAQVRRILAEPACLGHKFERHESFEDKYDLFWTIDKARREINMCMQARTQGWVAFGLTETGGMVGADIVLGHFNENDEPVLEDYWSTAFARPEVDITQDWDLIRAHRNETHTGFHGRRPIESCDDEDHAFTSAPNKMIWAFGQDDTFTQHAPGDRGGAMVSFLLREEHGLDGELVVDLVAPESTFPAEKSMYQCVFVKVPIESDKRFHLTSYELMPNQSPHMHHINAYTCAAGAPARQGVGLNTFFNCIDEMPTDCNLVVAAAVGLKKISWTPQAGMPVGGTDEDCEGSNLDRCFRLALLEIHIENKHAPLAPIVNPLFGLRWYVTEHLREHDLGLLEIETPHNDIVVPPGVKDWVVTTECSAECTAARLTEPLNLVLVAPHMHKLGAKIVVHHIRDGEAIAEYGKREHGWTDDITAFDLDTGVILPGDRLLLECEYDSSDAAVTTHGGKRREDEMCVAFLAVFPFQPALSACNTMASALPDKAFCGPPDDRFTDELGLTPAEIEAVAVELGAPLLPYSLEPFTRLDDIEDKPIHLCAALARYHVSDPQDASAVVVGPALVIAGYMICISAARAVLEARSAKFRSMSDANRRNVLAYIADTVVCFIVFAAVIAYRRWHVHEGSVIEFDATISSVAANVLLWTYLATLVYRSKVHVSTVLHHAATMGVIFLCHIAAYQTGAEQYNKIGALLLLMSASDVCGYLALLMHRFEARAAASAFLASTVWNTVCKTALFVSYWLVADVYPGRIRDFLEPAWTEAVARPLLRCAVTLLYTLQLYQVHVFYRLYLRLRDRNAATTTAPSLTNTRADAEALARKLEEGGAPHLHPPRSLPTSPLAKIEVVRSASVEADSNKSVPADRSLSATEPDNTPSMMTSTPLGRSTSFRPQSAMGVDGPAKLLRGVDCQQAPRGTGEP